MAPNNVVPSHRKEDVMMSEKRYYVWAKESCDNLTGDLKVAKAIADSFRDEGFESYVVDEDNVVVYVATPIAESKFGLAAGSWNTACRGAERRFAVKAAGYEIMHSVNPEGDQNHPNANFVTRRMSALAAARAKEMLSALIGIQHAANAANAADAEGRLAVVLGRVEELVEPILQDLEVEMKHTLLEEESLAEAGCKP